MAVSEAGAAPAHAAPADVVSARAAPADAAYQGAPGAFSEDAAHALVGPGATLLACRTLDDVFAALEAGVARAAVVPVENTLAGAVPGCADLLARHDVRIAAEYAHPIAHALIAPPGVSLGAVRRVYSHPVALAQCEAFFRAHPGVTPMAAFDTAGAVADLMRDATPDAAAIANRRAAGVWGGVVLADRIQDASDNYTRFLLVRPGPACVPGSAGQRTSQGPWRTVVVCDLLDEPGALARALGAFAARGLNLSRIESRPIRDTPFAYRFHLEVGPSVDEAPVAAALGDLAAVSRAVRVIGHYPAGAAVRPHAS
jgi:prephenate dehydratase